MSWQIVSIQLARAAYSQKRGHALSIRCHERPNLPLSIGSAVHEMCRVWPAFWAHVPRPAWLPYLVGDWRDLMTAPMPRQPGRSTASAANGPVRIAIPVSHTVILLVENVASVTCETATQHRRKRDDPAQAYTCAQGRFRGAVLR